MGTAAIDLAFLAAVVATLSACVGSFSPGKRAVAARVARASAVSSAALVGVAVVVLGRALWTVDPALAYVARHSSDQTPLAYRIAGIWGGMEGSLLFWSFIVSCTFAAGAVLGRPRPVDELLAITGIGGFTTAVFLVVGRTWASPFETLDVPTGSGNGLLAVLQHPAMVYHPPILYTGLALSGVPFALTLSALMQRRLDRRWRLAVIPWLRAGWLILGIGIVTGSQWAYAELGWGGFWAWDPVENSSLLPWLALTVAIHMLAEPNGRLSFGGAAAVVGAFGLMVCGVYVTRSGSTGSIHAFSESPEVGRPLLVFAAVVVVAGGAALAWHHAGAPAWPAGSRSRVLALQGVLGAVAIMAISLGTFWPVVDGLLFSRTGTRALVQPAYYHRALAPVAAASLLAMAVGPSIVMTKRRPTPAVLKRLGFAAVSGGVAALGITILAAGSAAWLTIGGIAVIGSAGAAIACSVVYAVAATGPPRRRLRAIGIAIAHCGFAIVMLGAVASSGGHDNTVRVGIGETVDLASTNGTAVNNTAATQLSLVELTTGTTGRYEFVRGVVEVGGGGEDTNRYEPELRAYESQRIPTAEAIIQGSLAGDTIVVLESVAPDLSSAVFTIRTRPLLPWVWVGAVLVLGGGFLTLAGRRRATSVEPDATPDRVATTAQR